MRTVDDVMRSNPVVVPEAAPVDFCVQHMRAHHVRHLPVVGPDGRLVGVVRDVDLARCHAAGVRRSVADTSFTLTKRTDPLVRALSRMLQARHEIIVVVDADDRPVGTVSEAEILALAEATLPPEWLAVDHASRPTLALDPALDVASAAHWMDEHGLRYAPLEASGGFAIASSRDFLRVPLAQRPRRTVREVVRSLALTAGPEMPLRDLVRGMRVHRFDAVLVVEGGQILAMLSVADVHRALTRLLLNAPVVGAAPYGQIEQTAW